MNNKENFKIFLINEFGKSEKTTKNYLSGINVISKELTNLYSENINIYKILDPYKINEFRQMYLNEPSLKEKNIRGQRMYTSALNAYSKYLSSSYYKNNCINNSNQISYISKPKGEFKIEEGKKIWKRNQTIVTNVLISNDYLCEYNISHKYFISNKTNNNYVEGHHLIPMCHQDSFLYSLDTEANVISLCPVCHKLLHFGKFEDKFDILKKLYKSRKEKLLLTSINVTFDELLSFYK